MSVKHGEILAEELHKLNCDIAKENFTMASMKKFPSMGRFYWEQGVLRII